MFKLCNICQKCNPTVNIETKQEWTQLECIVFVLGLCSNDISHHAGELPGLGLYGTRRGFQCEVDPQGESSFSLYPTHPQPMEWQQEGPNQQGWTGESIYFKKKNVDEVTQHIYSSRQKFEHTYSVTPTSVIGRLIGTVVSSTLEYPLKVWNVNTLFIEVL